MNERTDEEEETYGREEEETYGREEGRKRKGDVGKGYRWAITNSYDHRMSYPVQL